MGESVKEGRPYRSRIREQQAATTRRAILAAVEALIAERGYAATTVAAIAQQAGVAVPTVYFAFGSKRGLLTALHDLITERADLGTTFAHMMAEPDPRRQVRLAAHITRRLEETAGATLEAVRAAGGAEGDLQAAWQEAEANRRAGLAALVRVLGQRGHLKEGLTESRATDILWALVSHDVYRLLVGGCGWAGDDYEHWLTTTVATLLLA